MERQTKQKVQKTPPRPNHAPTQSPRSSSSANPLLELQRSIGNQALQGLIRSPYIQTKLNVSTPGDPYEQEADRVADTVMRMPEPTATGEGTHIQAKPLAPQITPLVQCESVPSLEEEKEEVVATKLLLQRAPLAVREAAEEEKVAVKLDSPGPQEEVEEETVATKLVTDTPLQRQTSDDDENEEKTLQTATPIQRQTDEEDEEEQVQTESLSSQLSHSLGLHPIPRSAGAVLQRLCTECEEEKEQTEGQSGEVVHRKSTPKPLSDDVEEQQVRPKGVQTVLPKVTTSVAANIHAMKGGGSPLPATTRAFFEPRFGADFSQVRAHTGEQATEIATALQARAFTIGRDIVFGAGEYAPESHEGRKLLAHELTHVGQQAHDKVACAPFPHTSSGRIQRQPAGNTPPNAPVSASAPEPTASVPSPGDILNRDLIKAAIASRDPADVKKIKNFAAASGPDKFELIKILLDQGWVGPSDEYALEDIWRSFGDGVVAVASTDEGYSLWQSCIDRGAELDDLPAIAKLRSKFETDIKAVVTGYLFQNRQLVMDEMQRLGIPADESAAPPVPTPEQTNKIENIQRAAASVAKLQRAQEEARNIYVGYKSKTVVNPVGPGAAVVTDPVKFNPNMPPESTTPPDPIFAPGVRVEIKPYQEIKDKYDEASKSIEGFLNLYPSIYAISREGQSTSTAAFAALTSPAQARQQLGVAMRKLIHDIEETQIKLDGGDLNPLDLTPIHDQLLGGLKSPSGTDWKPRLSAAVARDMVKDHQFAEALKTLGLQTAAAALFMLAPFTGGASIYLMLAGLAVTGVKLYLSTEQYENLAQAAKTSPKPGTELVTKGQVDEAKMAMEADQIAFALAALAVGTAIALKVIGAIKGPPRLSEPQGFTKEQFARLSSRVRQGTGHLGDDIRIHGSRAAGTAKPTSDVDIAIRVPKEKFDVLVREKFGTPNPGSAKERTMLHAMETGKIQAGEAGLRGLRQSVASEVGMEVDISVVRIGGPFDQGPWIPLQ